MFSKYLQLTLVVFLLLSIHACGGGGGGNSLTPTTPSLFGIAQKGSYLVDATLSFSRLSEDGKMTSEQSETKIKDNLGSFAIDLAWNDWTKMTVTGLFFNEFTGKESQNVVSLTNITDVGASSNGININLFTHMVATRIQVLLDKGQSLAVSKKQAVEELKVLLGLSSDSIETLDIASDTKRDNAILLLFSAGFLSTVTTPDQLTADLLKLTDDFADNALFDGVAKARFQQISRYAGKQGVLTALSATLKKRGHKNPPTNKTMGILPAWAEIDKSQNIPPVANAGSNQTIIEGQSITLAGSAVDNDGQIKAYVWTEGDTIVGREKTLKRTGLLVGKYTYTLTVTDDKGAQNSDSVTITVSKKILENKAPVANAGEDKTITEGQGVTLTGRAEDSDGSIQSYQWTQNGNVLSNKATLELNNLSVGRYSYTLTAIDNDNAKGEDSVMVVVNKKEVVVVENQSPTVSAGEDQTLTEGQSITLKGLAEDSDGSIQSYQWTQDGRVLGNKSTLELNNLSAGRYIYTLTVIDNDNAKSEDSVMVVVNKKVVVAENQPPTVSAGEDQTLIEGQSITLKGSAKDNDGTIQSYEWTENGNVLGKKETLERNNLSAGRYTYILTVTDNEGAKGSDSIIITVESKPLATIKVNLSGERCITAFGLHLRLISTLTGGITGSGPVNISRYAAANCSGGVIALPSAVPSTASATYVITNIIEIGSRKRTGTMTVTSLNQTQSTQVNIDENGNVSEK